MKQPLQSVSSQRIQDILRLLGRHAARAAGDESGAELVEFAISSALFFTVMFSVIFFSLMMYSYFLVADSARTGARYAMVRGSSLSTDCTAPGPANCIAQTGDIQTYVRNSALAAIKVNNLNVTTTWLTSTGGSCGTSDSCKAPGNQVQVRVTYSFPFSWRFVALSIPNLSSTSQMVIAQ